jgi:rsbT co-antagonist protein RsbR
MAEQIRDSAALALMLEMGLNESAIARRRTIVALNQADLSRIAAVRELVTSRIDDYTKVFFDFLSGLEEARPLLTSGLLSTRAKQLKKEHLAALVSGDYGVQYVEQRLELGLLYAKAGLEQRVFLGAFHHLMRGIGADIMQRFERTPLEGFDNFMSIKKVAFFDIGLITDVLAFERERVIRQQQEAIRELSTPVLQIRERLLLLPIIGVIDTHRARLITDSLLKAIRANRAKVVVMDITGVAAIDSRVANHIMQTVAAASLMGASVVVTGISSEVAQSLVALGIELSKLTTIGDLQGGLEEADRILGWRAAQAESSTPQPPESSAATSAR